MPILRVKQRLGLKHSFIGRTRMCFLAIVNVTYVTQCYDIKSSIVVKSWKKLVTHRQNGTLYFLIMVVRVSG